MSDANRTYRVGKAGGMAKIAMPLETIGEDYIRTEWVNGTIVFKPVKKDQEVTK